MVRVLGATAINYKTMSVERYIQKHTEGKGFDVIYDSIGGDNLNKSMEAAALNGEIVTTVAMVELDLTLAHIKGLSLHVVFMLIPMVHNIGREAHARMLQNVAKIVEEGELKPVLTEKQFSP